MRPAGEALSEQTCSCGPVSAGSSPVPSRSWDTPWGPQEAFLAWPHPIPVSILTFMLESGPGVYGLLLMGASQMWPTCVWSPTHPCTVSASPCLFKPEVPGCPQAPAPMSANPFSSPLQSPRYLALLASSLAPTLASLWQLLAPIPGLCSAVARLGTQCRAKRTVGHVGCWGRTGLRVAGDGACPSTEQQAATKAQREQELAANAFQELDDNMDGA